MAPRSRSRARGLVALTILVVAGGTVRAPTAGAAMNDCPPSHFCVWEHADYTGRLYSSSASTAYIGALMNDRTTSYWNRTRMVVSLYQDADYHGGCVMQPISPNGAVFLLPEWANDRVSSFRVASGGLC
ncbi:peptidase inhibitor family I36 protein [Streptomyces sp. NPDC094448]|uniref:peptidase inhibitor family I36 protein n=1 Tax=Streptomyces sp. NPDC094448 TaxID=3366063 RepID=UPI00382C4C27